MKKKKNINIRQIIILISVVFFFAISSESFSATYYVDAAKGNDSNTGYSKTTPLKSIQAAVQKVNAGDTCIVLPGTYAERVQVSKSGKDNAPIVIKAESSAVTRGFTVRADYVHVIGFEVKDTINHYLDGVGIAVAGKHCQIENNHVHDVTRSGIELFTSNDVPDSSLTSSCIVRGNLIERAGLAGIIISGRNHLIEENEISHILQYPKTWTNPPDWADADGMHFYGSGHIIRKNFIHDISMSDEENIDPHIDCFQTTGPAYDIIFEKNICHNDNDDMQGFMIAGNGIKNLTIRNNVILAFRMINAFDCDNMNILNNTFFSKLGYKGASGYGIELHDSSNAQIINNLFYDVGQHVYPYLYADSQSKQDLTVEHNCHYMSDGKAPKGSPWPNDLWQTKPRVVDAVNYDFHLKPESPLINAGKNLIEISSDLDDVSRPQDSQMDIGAFEFRKTQNVLTPPENLSVVTN